jgi:hypothetical protein
MCVDYRKICEENGWQWEYDWSYYYHPNDPSRPDAMWHVQIVCKNGIMCRFNRKEFVACFHRGNEAVKEELSNWGPYIRGFRHFPLDTKPYENYDTTYIFPNKLFDEIVKIMKPIQKEKNNETQN